MINSVPPSPYSPKPGDFGVVNIKSNVGRLIRLGQFLCDGEYANFEHAFIYIGDTNYPGGRQVVEAALPSARIAGLGNYKDNKIAWYSCPPDKGTAIAERAIHYAVIGTPYSILDYFAIAFQRGPLARKVLGKALANYVETSKHMICSQLVDKVYQDCGIQLFNDGRLTGDVTPADLYDVILTQKGIPYGN